MTHATLNEIQNRLTICIKGERDALKKQLDLAKAQYYVACDAHGNSSEQAGRFDKIVCSLQTAIEALNEI